MRLRSSRMPTRFGLCGFLGFLVQVARGDDIIHEIGLNHRSCGIPKVDIRIVNGLAAEVERFPWVVFLHVTYTKTLTRCAGAILTSRHILTAGHCTLWEVDRPATRIKMSYGSTNFQRGTVVYVKRYYRHEHFNLQTFENDVAVLLLEHPLKMGVRTRTVCLPTQPRDIAGTTVAVAGWGVTKQDGAGTTSLMYTTQVVLEPKDCQKGLRGVSFFHPLQLCAYKQGSDACQGDSGAPLVQKYGDVFEVVGLVSFGDGCNVLGVPGVYTNVFHYISWIRNAILDSSRYTTM